MKFTKDYERREMTDVELLAFNEKNKDKTPTVLEEIKVIEDEKSQSEVIKKKPKKVHSKSLKSAMEKI